ncbi:outer membrane protein assembly factor BamA [Nonlabens marinus]|uniref:Outer membrane protein assembly factor BamA n=1 Tax=Nonlabens marinus S1-08 TaxID=1454201 RepID=W8VV13_9FLAO|nr:outer membrane protein assembly factor BamA [Nonlabens marinus]BAO55048.1 outer membrane protein assembly factor YaeT precursor [Nonlabens marinus S1-08]
MTRQLAQKLLLVIALFISAISFSQKPGDIPIGESTEYIIGDITVTGAKSYNQNTVVAFTGLRKGDRIYVPGERLSNVVKKLWELKLFSDIRVYATGIKGDPNDGIIDTIDLEFNIIEVPTLKSIEIDGLSKNRKKDLLKELNLTKGTKANENLVTTTRNFIEKKYKDKGFLYADALVRVREVEDTLGNNLVDMKIEIDKGEKVKIAEINFEGNEQISDKKLRKAMKNTKEKNFLRVLKRSKYVEADYQEDLKSVVNTLKENGFRDARIISDTLTRINDKTIALNIKVEEGDKYYFGDIKFVGNTAYTDQQLQRILKVEKGDVYNGVAFDNQISDPTDPDARSLENEYQNNGYLFSRINAVETRVQNDTIDFEIRIVEDNIAYFNNISVKGNTRTNDHVIYRNIRSNPGEKYSKAAIINSIRELGQLGFFNAEKINPRILNPSQQEGTVDVEYELEEAGASQIELQGGYGGGGFVGTLGLKFNNFSLRNIFNKEAYTPVPQGDGQTLALRAQASTIFRTYSLNFTEPWLGGKKPVSFNVSLSRSEQFRVDARDFRQVDRNQKFIISGATIGLAKRLEWPDPYFQFSQALSFQHYNLQNYQTRLFNFPNGFSNNFAYTVGLVRDDVGVNPIFPTYGSKFSLTAKMTLPYSLWNGTDYENLENNPDFQTNGMPDPAKIDQERFRFLEYYKIKFDGTWYTQLYDKLVLQTKTEFGFLGAYNNDRGLVPFERFFVGGDGLGAFSLDGRDIIRMRGYENSALTTSGDGDTVYNKFSLEARYPITLEQAASIYVLTFAEAAGSYDTFRSYNPFDVQRSAGAGLRVFMPAFGLLGIDFGYGFDPAPLSNTLDPSGWQVHFIIGQQF